MGVPINRVVKSVVLNPGEQFVLPPGAILVATSDIDSLSSTCEIPDLEEYSCYISFIGASGRDGNESQYFEGNRVEIKGYKFNGIEYSFSSPYKPEDDKGLYDAFAMIAELKNKVSGIISVNAAADSADGARGTLTYIAVKTIPSIASQLSLILSTTVDHEGHNQTFKLYAPFVTRESVEGIGYVSLPECL